MICATRSGSARRPRRARARSRAPSRAARAPARTRRRPAPRASARSTRSALSSSASASSFERSSRSAVSFVSRSICSRIVATNSARASGSGSSSSSSSTKPPSEKIGVRSSCEALAMNSLRALSRRARRCCISLSVIASWPTSSVESTGIGVEKSPSATARRPSRAGAAAARGPGRRRTRPPAPPTRAIAPAIRIWRLISATLSSTSASGSDEDDAPSAARPPAESASAVSPRRAPPIRSTALAAAPVCSGRGRRRVAGRERGALDAESATTKSGRGPAGPSRDAEHGDPRVGALRRGADQAASSACERPVLDHRGERRPGSAASLLEPAQLLGGQARASCGTT